MSDPPSRVRCFIALELSDEARAELARLQAQLQALAPSNAVRWTPPNNIHLTLHFLGDVSPDYLETVARTVRDVAALMPSFSLSLSGLGCFPNLRRPRIVWVGICGEKEELLRLHRQLGTQLKQAVGFEPESRPYSPHLTIGRVKKGISPHRLQQLGQVLSRETAGVGELAVLRVDSVHFIRSDLTPGGPHYTPIAHGSLKG